MQEISFSWILIMFIYGAIDNLYQKISAFFKIEIILFLHMLYQIKYGT